MPAPPRRHPQRRGPWQSHWQQQARCQRFQQQQWEADCPARAASPHPAASTRPTRRRCRRARSTRGSLRCRIQIRVQMLPLLSLLSLLPAAGAPLPGRRGSERSRSAQRRGAPHAGRPHYFRSRCVQLPPVHEKQCQLQLLADQASQPKLLKQHRSGRIQWQAVPPPLAQQQTERQQRTLPVQNCCDVAAARRRWAAAMPAGETTAAATASAAREPRPPTRRTSRLPPQQTRHHCQQSRQPQRRCQRAG